MELITHYYLQHKAAEIKTNNCIINTLEEGLDLLGNLYYQDFSSLILQEHHFASQFFDLQKDFAVELLQKFSNYRLRLIIIADTATLREKRKDLNDFIVESNKNKQVNFVDSLQAALALLPRSSS